MTVQRPDGVSPMTRRLALLVTLSFPLLIGAAGKGKKKGKAENKNPAVTIVNTMLKTYNAMNSFEETSRHTMVMNFGGDKSTRTVSVRFAYRKPNKFLYKVSDPQQGVTIVCNGKTVWIYSAAFKRYMVKSAPKNIRDARDVLGDWGRTFMDAFAFLQGTNPYRDVAGIRLAGSGKVGKVPVDIVELWGGPYELKMPNSKTRLSIGKKDHLLYKSETTASGMSAPTSPGERPARASMTMTKTHSAMKVNQPIADKTFTFQPPRGARKVDSI